MKKVNDLKFIKQYYGEQMMHLCRNLFPTILEKEGLLYNLLEKNFAHSKFLYEDIIKQSKINEFKNYIYSLIDVEKKEIIVYKTPQELLNEANYILYECKTEENIENFRKYYEKNEELCTFHDNRLNNCYVFFAVKKNVEEIKREDFLNPNRQDEYGTSVISIQFTRGKINTLSIKNRYNHSVNNPDATFSNNLENIIPGLTKSFEKYYNLNINQNNNNFFELLNYVRASDGKLYKYNYEIGNVYYGPNNIIINNFNVEENFKQKEKYLVFDYFILDLENKEILKDSSWIHENTFINELKNINKIEIYNIKETKGKEINFYLDNNNITIKLDKYNRMISYKNENIVNIGYNFLNKNIYLEEIILTNVEEIDENFLYDNESLNTLIIPNVIYIRSNFLSSNKNIKKIDLPKVLYIGNKFLRNNKILKIINIPKVEYIGKDFLTYNNSIEILNVPNLKVIYDNTFMPYNTTLKEFYADNLEMKDNYLPANSNLRKNKKVLSLKK